jgi:hypothetical protein
MRAKQFSNFQRRPRGSGEHGDENMRTKCETKGDRYDLFDQNWHRLKVEMAQSPIPDPVGLIIDCGDREGHQLAIALYRTMGKSAEDAERQVDDGIASWCARGLIPTLQAIVPWAVAEAFLPCTSPTARQSLEKCKTMLRPGIGLCVTVAAGGNTYALISLVDADSRNN